MALVNRPARVVKDGSENNEPRLEKCQQFVHWAFAAVAKDTMSWSESTSGLEVVSFNSRALGLAVPPQNRVGGRFYSISIKGYLLTR